MMKPATLLVYSHGRLVPATRVPGGYMLPDGTVLRWLVW